MECWPWSWKYKAKQYFVHLLDHILQTNKKTTHTVVSILGYLHADFWFCYCMQTFEFVTVCRLLKLLLYGICRPLNLLLRVDFWICYCIQTFEYVTACSLLNLLLHADCKFVTAYRLLNLLLHTYFWICYCM